MAEGAEAVMAGIGHNGSPFDFFEFFDMVVNSSLSTAEKFIAIIHGRQIARRNGESYLSRAKAQTQASVSDNTYQRAMPAVRVVLQDERQKGKATVWRPRPDITSASIEEAILAMRGEADPTPKPSPKSIPQNGAYPAESAPKRGIGSPQNGVGVYPKMVGHKDQFKDITKDSPPTPSHAQMPRGGTRRDPFGLNPMTRAIRNDVWFDESCRIQVGNGFKAELLELTGSEERLRIELDRAGEWIGPNTPEIVMMSKVRGRVQSQMAERKDRDERYQRAANSKKPESNWL